MGVHGGDSYEYFHSIGIDKPSVQLCNGFCVVFSFIKRGSKGSRGKMIFRMSILTEVPKATIQACILAMGAAAYKVHLQCLSACIFGVVWYAKKI